MAVPGTVSSAPPASARGPLRLLIAGYVQNWSRPGGWLTQLASRLGDEVHLDVMLPSHWGGGAGQRAAVAELSVLDHHPSARRVGSMLFADFARFVASHHVAIDLFDETAERRLAMVTRTVTALASGTPVIHPPFTEVSPLIQSYDAGWLVDPADPVALAEVLDEIIEDREAIETKTANAGRLWAEHFDPTVATQPLVELLSQVASR
jgi:glycosyltransferase involved in cell wall biosynthesis